jgi:hypothetical protein
MTDGILRLAWPELAILPFQQLTGLRRFADVAIRQALGAAAAVTQRARRTAGRALRAVGARK